MATAHDEWDHLPSGHSVRVGCVRPSVPDDREATGQSGSAVGEGASDTMAFMSSRATAAITRMRRERRLPALAVTVATLGILALGGCQNAGVSNPSETASRPAGPIKITPQRDWDDAILYFALVDRFADGNPDNNPNVQPDNPGGWHGGDLRGTVTEAVRGGSSPMAYQPEAGSSPATAGGLSLRRGTSTLRPTAERLRASSAAITLPGAYDRDCRLRVR